MTVDETPEDVYRKQNGENVEFMYRAAHGKLGRAKILHNSRNGWTRVEFSDGEKKNVNRGDRWAKCPFEACELYLRDACQNFLHDDDRAYAFKFVKNAVALMENFDPSDFDEGSE